MDTDQLITTEKEDSEVFEMSHREILLDQTKRATMYTQRKLKDTSEVFAQGAHQTSAFFKNKVFSVFDKEEEEDDVEEDAKSILDGTEYDRTRYLVNHEKSSSKDFMDEITFKVPVKDLYEVIKVCTSNQGCDYQALLLKIKNEQLMTLYKGTHLVQVRNKQGSLIFQRSLTTSSQQAEDPDDCPIHSWNIFQSHFVYILSTSMAQEDYQYIYVIDLRGAERNEVIPTIRILNPFIDEMLVYDKIGFFQERELIIGAQTCFRHLDVGQLMEDSGPDEVGGHVWTLDVPEGDFRMILFMEVNVKVIFPTDDLRGLIFSQKSELREMLDIGEKKMALVFENEQNQLVFYEIKYNKVEGIHLIQIQDEVSRQQGIRKKWEEGDEIIKLSNILYWEASLKKYMHGGIALRKSGSIDFYYNFRLVEETCPTMEQATQDLNNQHSEYRQEKSRVPSRFQNVYAEYGMLYFTDTRNIYKCSMAWREHVGINQSTKVIVENMLDKEKAIRQVWARILKSRVHSTARLFPCFMLFFTKLLVAHSNIISVFDCITGTWSSQQPKTGFWQKKPKINHFTFEAPVLSIFRSKMDHDTGAYEIGVILANNTIRCLVGLESNSTDVKIELSDNYIQLPGGIEHLCFDTDLKENGKSLFLLIDTNKKYQKRATEINTHMVFGDQYDNSGARVNASFGQAKSIRDRWSVISSAAGAQELASTLQPIVEEKQMKTGIQDESSNSESSESDDGTISERDESVDSDVINEINMEVDLELKKKHRASHSTNQVGELLRQKVWKMAKQMNLQVGDKGFHNLRKSQIHKPQDINSLLPGVRKSQKTTFSLLNEQEEKSTLQMYAIIEGQLSKIKGIPDFPPGTTISLEYDCKMDVKQPSSGFLYVDNFERRLLSVYKIVMTGSKKNKSYYGSLVSKSLAYGTENEKQEGSSHVAEKREISAILGPQIEGAYLSESQRAKIKRSDKNKYRRIIVTNGNFQIYNEDGCRVESIIKGRNIRSAIQVDRLWTYTISDSRNEWNNQKKKEDKSKQLSAGLYLYDYQRMLTSGDLEVYKIRDAMGGVNSHLDFSYFMQRISFMSDLDNIEIIPVANRNVINFFGMRPRETYMTWHHNKNSGQFTAVDKTGLLIKWSTTTGLIARDPKSYQKIVVPKVFDFQGDELRSKSDRWQKNKVKPIYSVFKGDKNDLTYFKGWQNRGKYTIQLLVHRDPIQKFFQSKAQSGDKGEGVLGFQIAKCFKKMITKELEKLGKTFEYRKFLLIKLRAEPSKKTNQWIKTLFEFEHVYYPSFIEPDADGVCQRLYFNEDLTRMMERRKDSVCMIYERKDHKNNMPGKATKVSWMVWRTVQRYPSLLSGVTSYPFLFSPDFSYYLDIDYEGDTFIVRDVKKNGSVEHVIPSGLMSLSLKGSVKSKKALSRLAKLIGFYDNKHLRIVDKGGIDSIYNFRKGSIRQRLVCSSAIDNFVVNNFKFDHFIHETLVENPSETLERLVRIMDQTKVLQHTLRKMIWNPRVDEPDEKKKRQIMESQYAHLFSVDFNVMSDDPDLPAFITTELSFTFLDFQIVEKILLDRNFDLHNIDEQSRIQQCFNIYPGMHSAFHKLASTDHANFEHEDISKLYTAAQNLGQESDLRKSYVLPLIEDINCRTPLDLIFEDNVNINFAWQFLYNIKDYPFGHSGNIINRIIPKAIQNNVPDLDLFLDSRLKTSTHLQSHWLAKQALKNKSKQIVKDHYYDVTLGEAWEDKNNLVDRLFDKELFKKPMNIKYFDIPELHLNTPIGYEFWRQLGSTPESDIFERKVIQILINYKWRGFKPLIFVRFVIPYLLFIATFTVWSNFFYTRRTNGWYFYGNLTVCTMLLLWSVYFIAVEIQQMRAKGVQYFTDYFNYIDLIPLFLMIAMVSWTMIDSLVVEFAGIGYVEDYEVAVVRDYIQSLNAILMWYKFAYFLRVTDQTGWLIRMIAEVVYDLGPFLLVLLISLLAFTDAFSSMSISQITTAKGRGEYDPETSAIVPSYLDAFLYSYNILIGSFATAKFQYEGAFICYCYFIMATFFNLIVMLNLLIAIISDTYTRLQITKEQLAYQTKASIISDYLYLDAGKVQNNFRNDRDRMLIVAMETERKDKDTGDRIQLPDIMHELKSRMDALGHEVGDVKQQVKNLQPEEFDSMLQESYN